MNKTFKTIKSSVGKHSYNFLALPDTKAFKIEVVFDYGSNLENHYYKKYGKKVFGISHLTEHLCFKSPVGYDSDKLLAELKKKGNRNASTGPTHINYFFNTIMENMEFGIDAITKVAFNDFSRITDEEFESEKSVVMSEVGRYNDDKQTMFSLNTKNALMGTDKDDNILGSVEILKDVTLDDCKKIRALTLQEAKVWFNITYDPMEYVNEDDVIEHIERVLDDIDIVQQDVSIGRYEYYKPITIKKDEIVLPSESDRTIINLVFETDTNVWVRSMINYYVSALADETSLYNTIRDRHGLTYGVTFGKDDIMNVDHTRLVVDVAPDKIDLTMELIEEVMVKSSGKFNREIFEELMANRKLNITIERCNPKTYGFLFNTEVDHPELLAPFKDVLEDNISSIDEIFDDKYITFEAAKQYMNELVEITKSKSYSKVISEKIKD